MAVYPIAAVRGKAVGGAASYISAWLLRDDFTTPESAPIADPRTAEPGPGTLDPNDTGSRISIASGNLIVAAGGDYRNTALYSEAITRDAGIFAFADVLSSSSGTTLAWASGKDWTARRHGWVYAALSLDPSSSLGASSYAIGKLGIVLRDTGAIFVRDDGAGWYVAAIDWSGADTPLYWMSGHNGATSYATWRIAALKSPWNSDYGIATNRVASPSTGETTTMEADALIEFTWTPAAGETLDLMIRRDSDTDTWSVVCAESTAANANTIKLIERNSGDTERKSAAQTFNAGTSYHILVIVHTYTFRAWVNKTTNPVWTHGGATHNQTSTGVKVSGFTTGSELVVWPRTLSGDAAAALEEVANA